MPSDWRSGVLRSAASSCPGVPGRIQVAASTAALLDARWSLEPREVDVKGLGPMRAYLVVDG